MTEEETIRRAPGPRTVDSIARDLRRLGLTAGMTVLAHSSLSSLGWVCGGPVAVIQALMEVLRGEGTLVMPAHSGDLSDPSPWVNPPVPPDWWPTIRDTMPAYDPRITPTRGMGKIAENFRTWPGVARSDHPAVSFAALGRHALQVVSNHRLDFGLGDHSPLARIYDLDGWVLLLGVSHDRNTSLHLGEYRAPGAKLTQAAAPVSENGRRIWQTYQDIEIDTDPLLAIGDQFEKTGQVKIGAVGSAVARFFPQRAAVDFAQRWWTAYRNGLGA